MNFDYKKPLGKVFIVFLFFFILAHSALYAQMSSAETDDINRTFAVARFGIDVSHLILASISILCGLGLFVAFRGIRETIAEGAAIRLDAAALVRGDLMHSERGKHMVRIKKRGMGLRFKLASYTMALVLVVEALVSVPLFFMMTRTLRQTLVKSLWDRSTVLLEGLAANARTCLSQGNIRELGLLPGQMNSISEAMYVTITGYNPETFIFEDQVWASNDPNLSRKIDSQEFHPGFSRITDVLSTRVRDLSAELNALARERVSGYPERIANCTGK